MPEQELDQQEQQAANPFQNWDSALENEQGNQGQGDQGQGDQGQGDQGQGGAGVNNQGDQGQAGQGGDNSGTSNDGNQNAGEEYDFNQEAFLTEYKSNHPNATDEDVTAALNDAVEKHNTISPDIFSSSNDQQQNSGTPKFVDQFKQIAGEDFDEITHSTISNPEEFSTAVSDIVEKRVEKIANERIQQNDFVEKLSEEDKAVFNILKDKGYAGLRDFIMPDQRFNNFMSMTDENLVINYLKNQRDHEGKPVYDDETAASRLAAMDDEEVNRQAKIVRGQLATAQKAKQAEVARAINQDASNRQNIEKQKTEKFAEKLERVFEGKKDFFGMKIADTTGKAIADMYRKGEFEKEMQDPQAMADFILFRKIGKQAFHQYGKAKFKEGLNNNNQQEHNVDGLPNTASGSQGQGQGGSTKGFGGWSM